MAHSLFQKMVLDGFVYNEELVVIAKIVMEEGSTSCGCRRKTSNMIGCKAMKGYFSTILLNHQHIHSICLGGDIR